jgi:hypothetical protein
MTTATTSKVLLHACPRCHGDLFFDKEDEVYDCLQCGRETPLAFVGAIARIDSRVAEEMTPRAGDLRLVPALDVEMNDVEVDNDAA